MNFKDFFIRSSSKKVAKDRLQLILIQDRAMLSPELLDKMKEDIIKVITKYVDVEVSNIELTITKTEDEYGGYPALVANIPIKKKSN